MINKKILIAALLALTISVSAGCTGANKPVVPGDTNISEPAKTEDAAKIDETKQEEIMKEYESIISNKSSISDYISFMNKNIEYLSADNASKLVVKLEEMQREFHAKLEDKYFSSDIQRKIDEIVRPEYDLTKLNAQNIKDEEVKKLLEETINLGYKVETAEGVFFTIIDYSFYEKYSAYATQDIKDYISIMTTESVKVPAKDAALVISWNEVFERAYNQEKFLVKYKDSPKFEDIYILYNRYIAFAACGLDNTPLFDNEGSKINDDAKEAYQNAKAVYSDLAAKDGKLHLILNEYFSTMEKNEFKLTNEVKSFREGFVNDGFGC